MLVAKHAKFLFCNLSCCCLILRTETLSIGSILFNTGSIIAKLNKRIITLTLLNARFTLSVVYTFDVTVTMASATGA